MYNNAHLNVLAATGGGASVVYLGWWAAVAVAIGISMLLALRYRAQRKRQVLLSGE